MSRNNKRKNQGKVLKNVQLDQNNKVKITISGKTMTDKSKVTDLTIEDNPIEKQEMHFNKDGLLLIAKGFHENMLLLSLKQSYLFFLENLDDIKSVFQKAEIWETEVSKLIDQLHNRFHSVFNRIGKGEKYVSETFVSEIKAALLNAEKLPIPSFDEEGQQSTVVKDYNQIMETIKQDIQKGNRLTFKIIQELQEKPDSLVGQLPNMEQEKQEEKEESGKMDDLYLSVVLNTFDQLDLVLQSVRKVEMKEWIDAVELAVKKALDFLKELGIEEFQVLGEMFDGKVMQSIGAIPASAIETDVEQYHVYAVHQRGFRYINDQLLIRKAKVVTIL